VGEDDALFGNGGLVHSRMPIQLSKGCEPKIMPLCVYVCVTCISLVHVMQEVLGTVWEGDAFFGNGSLVRSKMPRPGAWSDVVRIILLHKYGNFWMDNDVILYRGGQTCFHCCCVLDIEGFKRMLSSCSKRSSSLGIWCGVNHAAAHIRTSS
jgi:hypothetical protein